MAAGYLPYPEIHRVAPAAMPEHLTLVQMGKLLPHGFRALALLILLLLGSGPRCT